MNEFNEAAIEFWKSEARRQSSEKNRIVDELAELTIRMRNSLELLIKERDNEIVLLQDRITTLLQNLQDQKEYIEEEGGRLQWFIDFLDRRGELEEHCITFPDGLTIWATGHEPKPSEEKQ